MAGRKEKYRTGAFAEDKKEGTVSFEAVPVDFYLIVGCAMFCSAVLGYALGKNVGSTAADNCRCNLVSQEFVELFEESCESLIICFACDLQDTDYVNVCYVIVLRADTGYET